MTCMPPPSLIYLHFMNINIYIFTHVLSVVRPASTKTRPSASWTNATTAIPSWQRTWWSGTSALGATKPSSTSPTTPDSWTSRSTTAARQNSTTSGTAGWRATPRPGWSAAVFGFEIDSKMFFVGQQLKHQSIETAMIVVTFGRVFRPSKVTVIRSRWVKKLNFADFQDEVCPMRIILNW